jgi:hypothetical protein
MSEYNVYLRVPEYLADWITNTFGNPVILVKDGPESRLLNEQICKTPLNKKPDTGEGSNISIPIPFFKGKHPETYNYIHKSGKKALMESFYTLLRKNLMEEVGSLENGNCKMATLIYAFMEKHGIEERHWYTVSQIYYRTRKKYFLDNGVKIR